MEKEFFELLGLGVPFYLAAPTYAVFAWLDNNASDEATTVISSWLHGRSQHKPDLGNLIISAFDRIYTSPLLRFRAFGRSASISASIWLLVALIPDFLEYGLPEDARLVIFNYGAFLATVVLIDYVSLLFVRRFLVLARIYPISASLMSTLVGILVLVFGFIVVLVMRATSVYWFIFPIRGGTFTLTSFLFQTFEQYLSTVHEISKSTELTLLPDFFWIMRPAFIIHLWLPLFALSSLLVRLIFWILRAVEWAQWFLKQGDAHPLKAIGIVATIIVFGSAMLVKEGWALLSVLERS